MMAALTPSGGAVGLRLVHAAATLAVLVVLAFATLFFAYAFLLLTGVAFHASTGRAHAQFVQPFIPIAYFAVGALVAGGMLALVNALVSPRPFWFKSIAAGALFGGLYLAIHPTHGPRLVGLAAPPMVDGKPVRYDVYVYGERKAYAIVDIKRASGGVEFSLACITDLSMGQRSSHKDECAP